MVRWNKLGVDFAEGAKLGRPEKNSQSKIEIRTQVSRDGRRECYHKAILAPHLSRASDKITEGRQLQSHRSGVFGGCQTYHIVVCIVPFHPFLLVGGKLKGVRPGDCVVAFSQQELYQLRREIEEKSGKKCAIVYGGLPPGESFHLNTSVDSLNKGCQQTLQKTAVFDNQVAKNNERVCKCTSGIFQ